MKARVACVLVAAVAASSLMFTGLASAGTGAETTVTIKGPDGDFHGKIRSSDAVCLADRTVRLLMSTHRRGPYERTGNSDTSERRGDVGVWSMGNTGLRDGFFFVKVRATPDCRRARSSVLHLIDGVPS